MEKGNLSRRGFVQRSLGTLAAAGLPAWYARQLHAAQEEGRPKKAAANDRLAMGIVGIGSPVSRSLQVVGESTPCVQAGQLTFTLGCDVNAAHRQRGTDEMRKRGFKDFEAKTKDFRDLVNDKSLDCLLVATPDHWHAQVAVEALKAGKDVYCEKPLTLTVAEALAAPEGGQGHRPRPANRQPAAHRLPRHVPPGGRAGPRRPPRQGQDHRVPHRRQPEERPDPGGAGPRGAGLGPLARPGPEGAVPQEGPPHELRLRVPVVVRVLRREDDRLGRPPPRHRPVGPGQGRQRARGRRGLEGGGALQGRRRLQLPPELPGPVHLRQRRPGHRHERRRHQPRGPGRQGRQGAGAAPSAPTRTAC